MRLHASDGLLQAPESRGESVEILLWLAFAGCDLAECTYKPGDNGHRRVRGQKFDNFFNSLKLVLLTEIDRSPCLSFVDCNAMARTDSRECLVVISPLVIRALVD